GVGGDVDAVEVEARPPAAALQAVLVAGAVDQDAAHGLGGGGEEVSAAVPLLRLLAADEAEVCLVNQRGGLKRLPGLLLGQFRGGELAQLVVDQRQQLGRGLRIAGLGGRQD